MTLYLKNTFLDFDIVDPTQHCDVKRCSSLPPWWKTTTPQNGVSGTGCALTRVPSDPSRVESDASTAASDDEQTPTPLAASRGSRIVSSESGDDSGSAGSGEEGTKPFVTPISMSSLSQRDTASFQEQRHGVSLAPLASALLPTTQCPPPPPALAGAPPMTTKLQKPKTTKLSTKAPAFVPAVPVSPPNSDIITVVYKTCKVLETMPDVFGVKVSEGAMGSVTSISAQVRRREGAGPQVFAARMQAALSAAKKTLLDAAAQSETAYILGYLDQPFQEDAPSTRETLRTNLRDLESVDPRRVLIMRKINCLGLASPAMLEAHFSQYGKVESVLISHSRTKSMYGQNPPRVRPAGLGFLVMEKAEDVEAILKLGREQVVQDATIHVHPFESRAVNEANANTQVEAERRDLCTLKATIGCITPLQEHSACWDTYQKGFCPHRDTCRWCHPMPKDLMQLVVLLHEDRAPRT